MRLKTCLRMCESGYVPAGLFTMTRFYTTAETSKRFGWFYFGNMFANAMAGIMAYGL